ncbi:TIGR03557 family F420-dependent LLM class oxidoreductase [Streptomyces sp. HNM0574]|uniref:TIGR03557 family F420-dependent LLM class oxidoreductase n=1 Tax=Streptomyces sp. HNM0574 TaxID=2714954 RepID=UPI00146BC17A|nr:TIGR03557 family F420-dependent LLM class oxidoreductase [Streptomyces sp. HNM0574]NLU68950.1 TIGR03557 family F420-dependent LLM class oxidoreductase [Streptomyces sp. HNM0574]
MTDFGYTLMGEQAGPRRLVQDAVAAERAGFDFAVASDHLFPWLTEQGHSPYVWTVLGAVVQATERLPLMSYVTCPTFRYHPVVVAQKAATVQLLSEGRFTLGLGSGENLNEHVVGPWPSVDVRHERLEEAIIIIRSLFEGGYVSYEGVHYRVESAKLWDVPDLLPPIGVAASGPSSCDIAGRLGDVLVATEPRAELCRMFDDAGGAGKRRVGQIPVSYDPDPGRAVARAHANFRWFAGGWKVNTELPGPAAFAGATRSVRPEDVAEQIPCGADVDEFVARIRPFAEAGFDGIALVQAGGEAQSSFIDWAKTDLLPALREAL